jgi:hypothetical protein
MLDWLMEPINAILQWLYEGIYQFFVETFAYFVEVATLGMIKFAITTTNFAWDVAKEIIIDIGVTDALNSAWSTLPGDTASTLSFFAIPDVINILLAALVTRWVLTFIPFTGK